MRREDINRMPQNIVETLQALINLELNDNTAFNQESKVKRFEDGIQASRNGVTLFYKIDTTSLAPKIVELVMCGFMEACFIENKLVRARIEGIDIAGNDITQEMHLVSFEALELMRNIYHN